MFKSLRNKFLLFNMAVTSLVILGAFALVYLFTYNNIQAENQRKLNDMAGATRTLHTNIQDSAPEDIPPGSRTASHEITASYASPDQYTPSFTLFFDGQGNLTGVDTFLDLPQEVYAQAAEIAKNGGEQTTASFYGRQWLYKTAPAAVHVITNNGQTTEISGEGSQTAFLDITESQENLRDLLLTFFLVGLGMLVVIFFLSLLYASRSIRPLSKMWEQQKQFVADASHELKTPLSIITSNYDALLANEEQTIQSQKEWLGYMKIGTDRLAKLISDLLALARMEDPATQIQPVLFDISRAILAEMAAFRALLQEKGLHLAHNIEPGIRVTGDEEMTRQVFSILYENAIKYTEKQGHVEVTLSQTKKEVTCIVKNSGLGTGQPDTEKIFRRFYRADPARTGEAGGYGLGLSIAQAMTTRLGGAITAQNTETGWTVFTLTLPTEKRRVT